MISITDMEAYLKTISKAELQEYEFVTVKDVLLEIQKLGAEQSRSFADKTLRVLTPLISFVDRYAKSMDSIVQNLPCPAAIVWGCLRALIRVCGLLSARYTVSLIVKVREICTILFRWHLTNGRKAWISASVVQPI